MDYSFSMPLHKGAEKLILLFGGPAIRSERTRDSASLDYSRFAFIGERLILWNYQMYN
jgi:hypothetical protein